jgi:hypothetical protein
MFGLSAEELLWNHTAFPYATALIEGPVFENALKNALGTSLEQRGLGAVTQNASDGQTHRRYCQRCALDELRHFGESFWHRSHNLPGVWACLRHGVHLHESDISIAWQGSFSLTLPHESKGRLVAKGAPTTVVMRIAEISSQWLARDWGPGKPVSADHYRALAVANGWLNADRQASKHALHSLLADAVSLKFLRAANLPTRQCEAEWPALMLRPGVKAPFVPVKHALLTVLLEQPAARPAQLCHAAKGPTIGPRVTDEACARAAERVLVRAIREGLVLSTADFLRSAGCLGAYRHRSRELPLLRAVVRRFRSSPSTVKRLGISKLLFLTPTV